MQLGPVGLGSARDFPKHLARAGGAKLAGLSLNPLAPGRDARIAVNSMGFRDGARPAVAGWRDGERVGLRHGIFMQRTYATRKPSMCQDRARVVLVLRPQCRLSDPRQTIGPSSALAPKVSFPWRPFGPGGALEKVIRRPYRRALRRVSSKRPTDGGVAEIAQALATSCTANSQAWKAATGESRSARFADFRSAGRKPSVNRVEIDQCSARPRGG
jgi:hypothetical protein